MKCPKCNCSDTKVTDTRIASDCANIRRRRKCSGCGHKFSTMEIYYRTELIVIKRNGREECFDFEKVMDGLRKAMKSDAINGRKIEALRGNILQNIHKHYFQKISSENIGQIVMKELKEVDPIAYLRFASVYKNFHEAQEFEQEFKNLKQ